MKKSLLLSLSLLVSTGATLKADHPCVDFSNGDSSLSGKVLTDVAVALAGGTAARTLEERLLFAFWPLWHSIGHHETKDLQGFSKWLASNWTTLGLSATVYAISKKQGWDNQKTFRYLLGTLYGQFAVAITAAKAQEFELI